MSNLVRFSAYSPEAATADSDRAASVSGNVIMELVPGENIVRFLPAVGDRKTPFRITAMHYIDAIPGLDKLVVFACPRVEFKQPCPACTECERLNKTGNPVDRERAFRISASMRIYANVVDRKHPDAGIKVLPFGKQIQQQLKTIRDNARLGGDFTDPTEKGFDVVITREVTGTGKNGTKYVVAADRQNTALADTVDEINDLLGAQHDLEQFVNVVPPKELLSYFAAQHDLDGRGAGRAAPQLAPARSVASPTGAPRVGAGLMAKKAAPAPMTVVDGGEPEDDFPPSYSGKS